MCSLYKGTRPRLHRHHCVYCLMNLYISTTWYAQCPGMQNYQLIYSNMESESMNLNTIRTDSEYNFVKLFNEALAENDDIGTNTVSPFDHGDNEFKYYSPESVAQNIHPTNNSLSLLCLNCRSISANWDCIHELIWNLSSRGFLFDIVVLTEVFFLNSRLHVIQYNGLPLFTIPHKV